MLDPAHIDVTRYVTTVLAGAAVLCFLVVFVWFALTARASNRRRSY